MSGELSWGSWASHAWALKTPCWRLAGEQRNWLCDIQVAALRIKLRCHRAIQPVSLALFLCSSCISDFILVFSYRKGLLRLPRVPYGSSGYECVFLSLSMQKCFLVSKTSDYICLYYFIRELQQHRNLQHFKNCDGEAVHIIKRKFIKRLKLFQNTVLRRQAKQDWSAESQL